MKTLVVDDDPIAREMLAKALTGLGCDVESVEDGQQAFDLLQDGTPRLVISDWQMPEMDGLALTRAIRKSDLPHYTYVILLTGKDNPDAVVEGMAAGADDFMVKPFRPAELQARVRAGMRVLSLETRDVTIFALAKLAESRDPETGGHLERVQNYAKVLAEHLRTTPEFADRIDAEYVRLIYATSPLHDIGKVAIPDCVLLKPGRLTDREFEIMRTHTVCGAETLEAAIRQNPDAQYLKIAHAIALRHHEKWDGSGYPDGLAGEDIPLSARIVALADVYDALMSKRAYKEAFNHDVAKSIIVEDRGKHFDPAVVDAFLACEQTFVSISNRFAEHAMRKAA
ncbi:MAG: HD domain-containing phosphohydrolase [Planctomycetota bacterium]